MNSDPPRAAVSACADSHRHLLAGLIGLTDPNQSVNVAASPSLLPDWTVGHVLTHLARNADGLARMVEAGERGEVAEMYPGGMTTREADIAAGAGRSASELVEDVRTASARLDAVLERAGDNVWMGSGQTVARVISLREVPDFRRREVEIHRVDLGLGYTFAHLPADFLRAELARMTGMWASRKPMGFTDLPPAALALAPADRLAWLTGRLEVSGLDAAGVF